MVISANITEFAGKRVIDFVPGSSLQDSAEVIPRLRIEYDSGTTATELLAEILGDAQSESLTGIVIGIWSEEMYESPPTEIMETLIGAAAQLPNLTALFIGEMTFDENEISWIQQCDFSPLWSAFPKLEVLAIRGTNELTLGDMNLPYLRSLTIQTGGLPKSVLQEVINAQLPELETLDLYFGTENYGWDGNVDDIRPLLDWNPFPKLRALGLRNSEIADQIAEAVAESAVLDQIKILDMSLGVLSDVGANALLNSSKIRNLESLDLHRHYISTDVCQALADLPLSVDVTDRQDGDEEDRYVSISE